MEMQIISLLITSVLNSYRLLERKLRIAEPGTPLLVSVLLANLISAIVLLKANQSTENALLTSFY
jgi:hypothetical protein